MSTTKQSWCRLTLELSSWEAPVRKENEQRVEKLFRHKAVFLGGNMQRLLAQSKCSLLGFALVDVDALAVPYPSRRMVRAV